MQLVQEKEIDDLHTHDSDERDEDGENLAETGVVLWRILLAEQQRANDVAGGTAGIVKRHNHRFLGGSACITDDPGDDKRVSTKEECEQVVSDEEGCLLVAA